jgi:hypothetical protein
MNALHWQEANGWKLYLAQALKIDSPVMNTPGSQFQRHDEITPHGVYIYDQEEWLVQKN